MAPLTITAAKKVMALFTAGDALTQAIEALAASNNATIHSIASSQVVLSSASADISDKNVQLSYPRVCLYSSQVKNEKIEKFRSLSGTVSVTADVWASADLVQKTEESVHFYAEAVTGILRDNTGDWGDGLFFSGIYDLQIQPLKTGGFGYVQAARITCTLHVSRN